MAATIGARIALRTVPLVLSAVLLALLAGRADRSLSSRLAAWEETSSVENVYAPPAVFLEIVSLGYRRALADVLWFRTVDYFGRHYNTDRTYTWLAHMLDRITELDPTALHVYRFAAFILPWEASAVDDSIALLEKGVRNLPDQWELQYYLGFNQYFFKDDLPAAAASLRNAARLPDVHPVVLSLASVIQAASSGQESAIALLRAELDRTKAPETRAPIEALIDELLVTRDLDFLENATATFEARLGIAPSDLLQVVAMNIIPGLPREPHGGLYLVEPGTTHVIDSLGIQPKRLFKSANRQKKLESLAAEHQAETSGAD